MMAGVAHGSTDAQLRCAAHHKVGGGWVVRVTTAVFATLALASCMEDEPAMKDCLRQFTEAECACLREAIPEEKWRVLDVLAREKAMSTRSRATALSLRANADGKCGPLEPRADASTL
jgi:hypothetical protein